MSVILFIIEEYILMEIVPYSEYKNIVSIIEERLNIANQLQGHEEAIQIKNACLSVTATLVLIILNQKQYSDLSMFYNIIIYILNDFLNISNERPFTYVLLYRT